MSESVKDPYPEAVNKAALVLLAMSFRPDLKRSLTAEIVSLLDLRGSLIDAEWTSTFDLRAVFDDIARRTMTILSIIIRERLPGVADEMDDAFGDRLQWLLGSFAHLFPTL
ncbi:MAG: hypothetical protein WA652_02115 [Xanthobacteraceae bacterium]